ncbi:MAG TPA: LptF/LptG family permease [Gemmatimonadaceae bacterium]|nr:LptF/LptG family permease [Gemmatimonadaceae bacterium]
MKIINRYVIREHLGPLVFALTALTSLLLLNYIAKRFGDLVGKGLGWNVIGEFFMLSIPFTVAMTLPMAVLVSTLYAFSRLAAENEITALKASGVGMTRVLVPVLIGATVIAGFMIFFNDQVLPAANHRLSTLQQDIARKKPTFALKSQVINEVAPGKLWLKADYIDQSTSWLKVVTIYDLSDPVRRRTIVADSGKMELAEGDLLLTLYSGNMLEVPKNEITQLQRLFYDVDRVRVRDVANSLSRTDSTNTYKGDREMSVCEMQRQFASHELDFQVARYALETALVNATRELTTGKTAAALPNTSSMPPSAGVNEGSSQAGYTVVPAGLKPEASRSIGGAYCAALSKLSKAKAPPLVKTASAAELPRQAQQPAAQQPAPKAQAPAKPAVQDTTKRVRRRLEMAGLTKPASDTVVASAARAMDTVQPATAKVDSAVASVPAATPVVVAPPPAVMNPIPGSSSAVGSLDAAAAIEAARGRMLENRTSMNRYDVEIQKKFALSAACVVFVLIGAPIALRFPRGGVGLVIGVSLVVFAIYYIGLIAGESLADRAYLTPFWAMWAANVILTGVGLVLLVRMGKEGATSRGGDLSEFFDAFRTNLGKAGRRVGLGGGRQQ